MSLVLVDVGMGMAGVQLADDRQQVNLPPRNVELCASHPDIERAVALGNLHRIGIEFEDPQKVDEIGGDVGELAEEFEFFRSELQRCDMLHLLADPARQRPEIDPRRAAPVCELDLCGGAMM